MVASGKCWLPIERVGYFFEGRKKASGHWPEAWLLIFLVSHHSASGTIPKERIGRLDVLAFAPKMSAITFDAFQLIGKSSVFFGQVIQHADNLGQSLALSSELRSLIHCRFS